MRMASSYEEATYTEIIYLSKVLGWGFDELWNLPVAMRKRFIKMYNRMEEDADKQRTQRQQQEQGNITPVKVPEVFRGG